MSSYRFYIPGAEAAGRLAVYAPYDNSLIAEVPIIDKAGAEIALQNAWQLFRQRDAWLSVPQRLAIFSKAIHLMHRESEELALTAAREGGKPLVDSQVEVARAIEGLRICIDTLRTDAGEVVPMGINAASQNRLAMTQREPIGVVLAVSAFNHPLNLIVHQVAPAIAAGCPVIIKPAESTPLSCLNFVRILQKAGLPPEWCQVAITEDHELVGDMVSDRRVGFFSFIGNAKVGWMLRQKLAPGARCALEHGGAAPVIVAADADLDNATPLLAKAAFYHAGQVCVSVQRVFAHHSIARDLAERLAKAGAAMSVGDPTSAKTDVGPMIRQRDQQRVHAWVQNAIKQGAECLGGGELVGETCYAPTVLYNPPADAEVSQLEIFGPVVCVYPYDDLDAAIAQANSLPYAFQAAVFARDINTAMRAYQRLDASAVMVNDHTAFRVDWMPFAGLRESGLGVGGIPHTMRDMQIDKMLVIRTPN